MKTTKKSRVLPSLMIVLFAAIFAFAGWFAQIPSTGAVYAEDGQKWTPLSIETENDSSLQEINEPLDFIADPATRTGAGWAWDNDTKTLTLKGAQVNLSSYKQDYEAGIKLPEDATVDVQNLSGVQVVGKPGQERHAIKALGALTIKGNTMLQLNATQGANGVYADGPIQLGEGTKPDKGVTLYVIGTSYAVYTDKKISVNGANLELSCQDSTPRVNDKGVITSGGDTDGDSYAIDVQDSSLYMSNVDNHGCGILAEDRSVRIKNSSVRHEVDRQHAKSISGIMAVNGNVDIEHSDATMELLTFDPQGDSPVMIGAAANGNDPVDLPKITISDSMVNGIGEGIGMMAEGEIKIDSGSDVDITTNGYGALVPDGGFSVEDSNVRLTDNANNSDAIFAKGAVSIKSSEVYLTGKGTGSSGLYSASTVDITGDSYVDMEGKLAAVQVIADRSAETPVAVDSGLEVRVGGSLEYIDPNDDPGRIYSYSEGPLEVKDGDLKNASTHVVIASNSRLMFLDQPQDQMVRYPDGTSFEVRMSREDKVASYQWYCQDYVGNTFELKGQSATTDELIVPSTDQRDNRLTYYCVVTDTKGNKLVSKDAYLDIANKNQNKTVLYVGEYAVNPGETFNIGKQTNPSIGTGKITFDENGKDITMENVVLDNSNSLCDIQLANSKGIRLDRKSTPETEYTITLIGKNKISNFLETPSGNGITVDFMLRGEESGDSPTVTIDGESKGGTLLIKGGTEGLRSISHLVVNADVTIQPATKGDASYLDAFVIDQLTDQGQHNLTIGKDHKLDIKCFGAGMTTPGSITVEEGADIDIDMTMPRIISAGSSAAKKAAVFVGKDKLELKPGSNLNLDFKVDPDVTSDITEAAGILLTNGAGFIADKTSVDLSMLVMPYEDPGYVPRISGISADTDINVKDSELSVMLDADKYATRAFGVVAGGAASIENSDVDIDVNAGNFIYGLAPNETLTVKSSKVDVKTEYVNDEGTSYGVLGTKMNLDLSGTGSYIKSDASNDNGLAFVADTKGAGDDERKFDPSYKSRMITGDFDVLKPVSSTVNITSIPGNINKYLYVETVYDENDTSKPANYAMLIKRIPVDNADVKLSYASTTYDKNAKTPDVTVTLDGTELKQGVDYDVKYSNNVNAGKATVTVNGTGSYIGSKEVTFIINKAANPLTIKAKTATVKGSTKGKNGKLKKTKTLAVSKVIAFTKKGQGKMTYTKASGNKKIKIAKTTGKVTVKKGLKKGAYKVKVKVKAAGSTNYKASAVKTVTFKIKVIK